MGLGVDQGHQGAFCTALSALATSTTAEDRAKTAILLVLTAPASAIQK